MRELRVFAGALALLVCASGPAAAQGRGHGRGRESAPGQAKKAERAEEARFADRDRETARNWYAHERRGGDNGPPGLRRRELPPGLRDRDRLPPGLEARLRPGFEFDPDLRARLYPVPIELRRTFAPPPPGYSYFVFGGHFVLVDASFRLADDLRLDIGLVR